MAEFVVVLMFEVWRPARKNLREDRKLCGRSMLLSCRDSFAHPDLWSWGAMKFPRAGRRSRSQSWERTSAERRHFAVTVRWRLRRAAVTAVQQTILMRENKTPPQAVCNSSFELARNKWNPAGNFRLPVKACRLLSDIRAPCY